MFVFRVVGLFLFCFFFGGEALWVYFRILFYFLFFSRSLFVFFFENIKNCIPAQDRVMLFYFADFLFKRFAVSAVHELLDRKFLDLMKLIRRSGWLLSMHTTAVHVIRKDVLKNYRLRFILNCSWD